jgi:hypothetical protein
MLKLHWDSLDHQTKEQILFYACVNERYQHYEWSELEQWLKGLIVSALELRSNNATTVGE